MIDWPSTLHWLRPHWLWALLALPPLWIWWSARRRRGNVWQGVVDPHLLPHLLERAPPMRRNAGLLAMVAYGLAVIALAGPSWRQAEQPLWQTRAPLVIALDLSSASLAPDLPPTRLLQARAKIATLLRERAGGQVGLVVYADDAFTVAPLTDDSANLGLFLDSLSPDVMPVDGSRGARALARSAQLLRQAGFDRGDILLLTDHADAEAIRAAADAASAGYRTSALGLGSATGSAYRTIGGSIAHARLDESSLRAVTRSGNGVYVTATPGDGDLRDLGILDPQQADGASARGEKGRSRQDGGYWLLPPLMLLALFAFRRGGTMTAALLLCLALPMPSARAAEKSLWRRADQQAHLQMQQGTAAYRKGDFDAAQKAWSDVGTADAHYNVGNALAKEGHYPEAIAAYDRALRAQPGMADALANKRAVEAAMKRKPPQGGKQDNRGKDDKGKSDKKQDQDKGEDGQSSPRNNSQPSPSQQQQPAQQPDKTPQDPASSSPDQAGKPADAAAQRAADAAQRERMRQALARSAGKQGDEKGETPVRNETPAEREQRQANEAWLRRVPDDPGGLLRAKFRLEMERRQQTGSDP